MLVIISDLHLTDGTSGTNISPDAFRVFIENLGRTAANASERSNGEYRPIERIDIVMLGDVFEHLRTGKWFEFEKGEPGYVRPWDDQNSPLFINLIERITDGILEYNNDSFAMLRELANDGLLIPARGKTARKPSDTEMVTVPVYIHYFVGNHDWFMCIPNEAYNPMRQRVIEAMGLANDNGPFPHDPSESPKVKEVMDAHGVLARHGDIFDKLNYEPELGRSAATLGDAYALELFGRFPFLVQREMGHELPPVFLKGLKEFANVRPAILVPAWIDGVMNRNLPDQKQRKKVEKIWNQLAEDLFKNPFVQSKDSKLNPFETVDVLKAVLTLGNQAGFNALADFSTWLKQRMWGGAISFANHALKEEAFLNRSARYIVYGHVHNYEVVPLDSNIVNGKIVDQVYVNSGTWHSVHDLSIANPYSQKFMAQKVMTVLFFFKDDERGGRPFESWNGTLSWATNPPPPDAQTFQEV